jgi:hypothetical protein
MNQRQRNKQAKKPVLVEIARSFSYKLNLGNYQSADFFMSQKSQCSAADAEVVSEGLAQFVKSQVLKSVREFQLAQQERKAS